MKFSITDFFSKCDQIGKTADLVTFTEEILNENFIFCTVIFLQTHKHSRHEPTPVILKTAILTSFQSVLEYIRARIQLRSSCRSLF